MGLKGYKLTKPDRPEQEIEIAVGAILGMPPESIERYVVVAFNGTNNPGMVTNTRGKNELIAVLTTILGSLTTEDIAPFVGGAPITYHTPDGAEHTLPCPGCGGEDWKAANIESSGKPDGMACVKCRNAYYFDQIDGLIVKHIDGQS